MKVVKFVVAFIEAVLIGMFVIPFSIGKIHKNVLKAPLMVSIYWLSFTLAAVSVLVYIISKDRWFFYMAVSLDQTGNTALGGDMDNTMSGRLGEKIVNGTSTALEVRLCRALSVIDPTTKTHCISSIE